MVNILVIIEIVPNVVCDSDVPFETDIARVESGFIEIADNATAVKVLLPNCDFTPNQRKSVDDDG